MTHIEDLRPGALPADYKISYYRPPEDLWRERADAELDRRLDANEARQAASLGESGEIFLPATARPKILTCPCGAQAIAGSPAAAEHKRDHGQPR